MNVSALVADRVTGKAIPGVTVWGYAPDGQSAEVLGYTDSDGNFEIPVNGITIAFEKDGYTGLQIPDDMITEGGTITLSQSVSSIVGNSLPAWVWEVIVLIGFVFLASKKKR